MGSQVYCVQMLGLVQCLMQIYYLTTPMQDYQQLDTQALVDLLATETQDYTRAFLRGAQDEIAVRRIVMEAIMAEIRKRKKEDVLPQNVLSTIESPEQPKQD